MNLVVRELERSVVKMTPDLLTMESETVLTQYIIKNWTLAYRNISKHHLLPSLSFINHYFNFSRGFTCNYAVQNITNVQFSAIKF